MLLYHGTSSENLKKIEKYGLITRHMGAKSNWDHTVESDPKAIYLTDAYALYFAIQCLSNSEGSDKAVIVEIDTDKLGKNYFVADEDALEQAARNMKGGDGLPEDWTMEERTIYYRNKNYDYAVAGYGHEWSLKALGTCAYKGKIPLEAITRIAIIDVKEQAALCYTFMDPSITLLNYRFVGAKYRVLSKMIFGDEPNPEDIQALRALAMDNLPDISSTGIEVRTVEYKKKSRPKKLG